LVESAPVIALPLRRSEAVAVVGVEADGCMTWLFNFFYYTEQTPAAYLRVSVPNGRLT
jgi:hypothetical protein